MGGEKEEGYGEKKRRVLLLELKNLHYCQPSIATSSSSPKQKGSGKERRERERAAAGFERVREHWIETREEIAKEGESGEVVGGWG